MSVMICQVKTPFLVSCGGRCIIVAPAFSRPRPKAGNEDVNMLIQRISNGESGKTETPDLSWKPSPTIRSTTSPTLEVRRWRMNF
ncbi:hypothetical protein ACKS0A_07700 [Histoplasma ohiense]